MAVAVRGIGPVLALDAPDARQLRIDVKELVHDRVELRDPRIGARIEPFFLRPIERLVAEPGQRERDHVLDVACADRDDRRFRDEPLRAASQHARGAVAPEVITGFAGGQAEAMTRCERAFRIRSSGSREDEHVGHVDVGERRDA